MKFPIFPDFFAFRPIFFSEFQLYHVAFPYICALIETFTPLDKRYGIDILKLKPGKHSFDFELKPAFFKEFGGEMAEQMEGTVKLELEKTGSVLKCLFHLNGKATLACDRCLLPFDYPIVTTQQILYSYEKNPLSDVEESPLDEVYFIDRKTDFLDFKQDFYDFFCLAIPFRKIPEDCPSEKCPPEVLKAVGLQDEAETDDSEVLLL